MAKKKVVEQGQMAEELTVPFDKLNQHEQAIVNVLNVKGRPEMTIKELMEANNWHKQLGKAKGNSRVRNSLRRLVRGGWVMHPEDIGDGRYFLTKTGADRLRRFKGKGTKKAAAKKSAKKAAKAA